MTSGSNLVKYSLKNNSTIDIASTFSMLYEALDANGKVAIGQDSKPISSSVPINGLKAGQELTGDL